MTQAFLLNLNSGYDVSASVSEEGMSTEFINLHALNGCHGAKRAFPLFTCSHVCSNNMAYCVMEKLLIVLGLIAMGLIIHQLYLYIKVYKINYTDSRVVMILLALLNCI